MAYNTAIKYLQDTYGVKVLGLTMDAENTLKRINLKRFRDAFRADVNNHITTYEIPPKDDYMNYNIHLLITQYRYGSPYIKYELEQALENMGVKIS